MKTLYCIYEPKKYKILYDSFIYFFWNFINEDEKSKSASNA